MENSKDDSNAKPEKQIQENRITNDEAEETCSKPAPNYNGTSDNSNDGVTSERMEYPLKSSNGEGPCSFSPDEIKQIVANFLITVSAEGSTKGSSEELRASFKNFLTTTKGKEPADHDIKEFTPDESSKRKSRFSRLSSGKKKKTSAKLSRRKHSRSKSLKTRGGSTMSGPNTDAENSNSAARERRRNKKKKLRENADDIFIKIRKQLRYILNKIQYEQSLIDAYGGEGWKGLSIDKLKPEKELQRANSEILRCKLRLRDQFQHLDTLCAEGSYPKSMFDSEGLLDSEDIYCTICGAKDLSADNDIVLCDGECNRAFHQLCLKPPLLTEEIPPDDQGWLCPGCDCKFDCMELLNEFFGTDLSIKDNWKTVFPEAAAAADGASVQDEILKLPSDDSEDDDFDPDTDVVEKTEVEKYGDGNRSESSEGEESASDESDFTSDSEDLGEFLTKEQLDGNPPDNSEEEEYDYNPEVPEADEQDEEGISSSDSKSDSDDFAAEVDNITSAIDGNSEESLAALKTEQESPAPVSNRRDIERLDYKKLYDDTYGNESSESSDDEEWTDAGPSRKRKNKYEVGGCTFPNNNIRASKDGEQSTDAERNIQGTEYSTPRSNKKLKSSSVAKASSRMLGEVATQKLSEAFQKNQYPERAVKESLAKELEISYQKVDKWFGNARWSVNHPLHARTVSKSDVATKSPAQAPSGSKAGTINNSSNNLSFQNLLDAKTMANDDWIKISSPPPPPPHTKVPGKRHQSMKLSSPNSSVTDTSIQGGASKNPPLQSNTKRWSTRLQETCTSISSRIEVSKGNANSAEGSASAGESGVPKLATTSTPNIKQKGRKEVAYRERYAKVEVLAQTTAEESKQNGSRKRSTKPCPSNEEAPKASAAGASTNAGGAVPKRTIQTRSRK